MSASDDESLPQVAATPAKAADPQASVNRQKQSDPCERAATRAQPEQPSWAFELGVGTLLTVSIFAAYWHTLSGEFVWDDRAAIRANLDVQGKTPWTALWQHDFWGGKLASKMSHKSYRPICVLSFRLDFMWTGFYAEGYHMVNVALHAVASYCVYVLGKRFMVPAAAALSAGIFALHPVHTESVAGIVGRADILATIFMVLGVLTYQAAPHAPGGALGDAAQCVLSLLLALLAALSKESGATVIGIFVACDLWRLYRSSGTKWRVPLCRIGANVASGALFLYFRLRLHGGHELRPWGMMENHLVHAPPSLLRTLTVAHSHALYARFLLWPPWGGLSYDHGFNASHTAVMQSLDDPRNLQTVLAYAALIAAVLLGVIYRHWLLIFSLAWALLSIVPALNVFFWVGTVLAERLLYIPSVGFCLVAGYVLWVLLTRESEQSVALQQEEMECSDDEGTTNLERCTRSIVPRMLGRMFWASFIVGAFAAMGLHTYTRCMDWVDEPTLYESGYRSCPNSVKVLNNLAQVYLRDGNKTKAAWAMELLTASTEIFPSYASADFNMGLAASTLKDRKMAVAMFERALSKGTESAPKIYTYMAQEFMEEYYEQRKQGHGDESLIDRAMHAAERAIKLKCSMPLLWFTVGNINAERGKSEDAVLAYQRALRLNDNPHLEAGYGLVVSDVENQMGLAHSAAGNLDLAIASYERALETKPDMYEVMVNMGVALSDHGRRDEAVIRYEQALSIVPNDAVLLNNMGHLQIEPGKFRDAIRYLGTAHRLLPTHPSITNNMHIAMDKIVKSGDPAFVMEMYRLFLEYAPDDIMVLNNLGHALILKGNHGEAQRHLRHALKFAPNNAHLLGNLKLAEAGLAAPSPPD